MKLYSAKCGILITGGAVTASVTASGRGVLVSHCHACLGVAFLSLVTSASPVTSLTGSSGPTDDPVKACKK